MNIKRRLRGPCTILAVWTMACCAQLSWAQPAPPPTITKVPELATDRWNFDSPLWDKATLVSGFKAVVDGGAAPATAPTKQTEVRLAHDGENLYVRYTMLDDAAAQLKTNEFDEFGDEFPQGDHGELWVTQMGAQVYAFDPAGNKYDAQNYDRKFFSGFVVKSRKGEDRWQTILVIPLKSLLRGQPQPPKGLSLAFVRHVDRGEQPAERSTASGQPPTVRINYALE